MTITNICKGSEKYPIPLSFPPRNVYLSKMGGILRSEKKPDKIVYPKEVPLVAIDRGDGGESVRRI